MIRGFSNVMSNRTNAAVKRIVVTSRKESFFSSSFVSMIDKNDDDHQARRRTANIAAPHRSFSSFHSIRSTMKHPNFSMCDGSSSITSLNFNQHHSMMGGSNGIGIGNGNGNSNTYFGKRRFNSSSDANNDDVTNMNGEFLVPVSPEEEIAKFEQNATAAAETAAEAAVVSADSQVWQSTWWPHDQMVDFILFFHDTTGLNYAITIGAITFSFRSIMLPMFIKAQQNTSRMAHVKPEMDVIKAKIDKLDPKDLHKQQEYAKEMQRLFQKYDVNPFKSLLLPIIQMPVFMSMFFALKKMPDYFPTELSDGGILWFTDLSAPDPYYALPIFSGLTFYAMMELNKKSMLASSPEQGQMMLTVFRGLAVMIVPFSMYFPTAVLCYWTVNNSFSLAQSALFQNTSVKKMLGIWELPKPVPGAPPPKGMMDMIQDSMANKRKEGTENNIKQRIEIHNAAVDKKMPRKKNKRSRK